MSALSPTTIALEKPRAFGIIRQRQRLDFAVELDHVPFEFRGVTDGIAPDEPWRTVIIDQYGRVDVIPTVGTRRVGILDEGFADRILPRADRRIGNAHAKAPAAVALVEPPDQRGVMIEFAVSTFDDLTRPAVALAPGKRTPVHDAPVFLPGLHIL